MWKQTPLAAPQALLDILSHKGGKAEMSFKFSVFEVGWVAGCKQRMNMCYFIKMRFFSSFSEFGDMFSSLLVLSTFVKAERYVLGASPPIHLLASWDAPVFQGTCEPQNKPMPQGLQGSTQCTRGAVLQPHEGGVCPPFPSATAHSAFKGTNNTLPLSPGWCYWICSSVTCLGIRI